MKWNSLQDWHELDRRLKARLDNLGADIRFRGVAPEATAAWLTARFCLTLMLPLMATPLVTWILYPWLPQPDAWIYLLAGLLLGLLALGAHHEYKKLNQSVPILSDCPPAPAEMFQEQPPLQ